MKTRRWAVVAAAAALSLTGCGAADAILGPTEPSVPTRSVVGTQSFTALATGQGLYGPLTIAASGLLDVVANWTFSSNDLDIYLTHPGCASTSALVNGGCTILASARTLSKPERFTYGVAAGEYRVWVVNFGPGAESGTLEVGITR